MTDHETVQLSHGPIRYRDTGPKDAAPIVFVHGFLVDSRLWDGPADRLAGEFRCLQPDLPMGSHWLPMKPDADLTPPGVARLIADFLEALDLEDVTIVGNDSGGAMSQVLVTNHPQRIGRLILTNCDSYEHFPPGPFKLMPPMMRVPGGMSMVAAPFRIGPVARWAYDQFTFKPAPRDLIAAWLEPSLTDGGIKRDATRLVKDMNKRYTLAAAERFGELEIPVLLAWGRNDRVFRPAQAERLAKAIPGARLEWIDDARTFVALDQPDVLAERISAFMHATRPAPAT